MGDALFDSFDQVLTTVVSTALIYAFALVAVRLAGRRTLAQLSAFDILVTIAAGTVAGSAALPSHPTVADGAAVLATLFTLQVVLGYLRQRVPALRRLVDFSAQEVIRDGKPDLRRHIGTAQLTTTELMSELRLQGVTSLDQVALAVLEPSGKVSVLRTDPEGTLFANPR